MITYNCDACEKKIEGKPLQISVMVTPIATELYQHTREIARGVLDLCGTCHQKVLEPPESETLARVAGIFAVSTARGRA